MVKALKRNPKPLKISFTGKVQTMGDMYIIYIKKEQKEILKDYLHQNILITIEA